MVADKKKPLSISSMCNDLFIVGTVPACSTEQISMLLQNPNKTNQKWLFIIIVRMWSVRTLQDRGTSVHDTSPFLHLVPVLFLTFHLITIQITDIPILQDMVIIFTISSTATMISRTERTASTWTSTRYTTVESSLHLNSSDERLIPHVPSKCSTPATCSNKLKEINDDATNFPSISLPESSIRDLVHF